MSDPVTEPYPFAACARCGSTLERRPGSRSLGDRLRGRTPEPELVCPRCGWTTDQPVWPTQADVGSGELRIGSIVSTRVGSLAFENLSARDATELATLAAAAIQAAPDLGDIPSAIEWFRRRHGPPDDLDRSGSWRSVDAADVPWWCWFRDGSQSFVPLGVEICRDVDAMAAAAVRQILEAHPGAVVRRSDARSEVDSHFRRPVVALPGGGEVLVHPRFATLASRMLRPWGRSDIDGFLGGFAWIGRPLAPAEEDPPYEVEREPGGCSIHLSDAVAHESEELVERLVSELATAPHVDAVTHEDRELILVRTQASAAVERWLREWWARNA